MTLYPESAKMKLDKEYLKVLIEISIALKKTEPLLSENGMDYELTELVY
jgi:hypothetical protein